MNLRPRLVVLAASVITALALTGCGSSAEQAETATSPDSQQTGGPGALDVEAIQECLTAAGLDDVLPEGAGPGEMPEPPEGFEGEPGEMPNPPADGERPEGMPEGGPGGGMGLLQDPEVQAALEACGLDLPVPPEETTS